MKTTFVLVSAAVATANAVLIQDITPEYVQAAATLSSVKGVVTADFSQYGEIYIQEPLGNGTPQQSRAIVVLASSSVLKNSGLQEGYRIEVTNVEVGSRYGKERTLELTSSSEIKIECDTPDIPLTNDPLGTIMYCDNLEITTINLQDPERENYCKIDDVDTGGSVYGMLAKFGERQSMYFNYLYNWKRYGRIGIHPTKRPLVPTQFMLPSDEAGMADYNIALQDAQWYLDRHNTTATFNNEDIYPTFYPRDGITDAEDPAERRLFTSTMELSEEFFNGRGIRLYRFNTETYRYVPTLRGLEGMYKYLEEYDLSSARAEETFDLFNVPQNDVAAGKQDIRVGGLNVENYFITYTGRGARSDEERARQEFKIFLTVKEMDAAIFALQEMENHDNDEALVEFVKNLNEFIGEEKFDYIKTGKIGGDAIKTAIIYQPAFVTPIGDPAVKIFTASEKHRPAVAQTFQTLAASNPTRLTVASVHFKSKGGGGCTGVFCADPVNGCGLTDDGPNRAGCVQGTMPFGDGQANWSELRREGAQELAEWIYSNPTGEQDLERYLVLGDFNMYRMEDGMRYLRDENGFFNMVDLADRDYSKNGEDAISYRFNGLYGTLDYAMASQNAAFMCGDRDNGHKTVEWNTNSIELDEIGYKSYNPAYAKTVYRSSDHDPILTSCDLTITETAAPVTRPTFAPTTAPPTVPPNTLPGCSTLFIRETGDRGFDKWISIQSTSENPVDIGGCAVKSYVNGNVDNTRTYATFPDGTLLQPGHSFSMCSTGGGASVEEGGTGNGIVADKLADATQVVGCECDLYSGSVSFNGNDPLFIEGVDGEVVDFIGIVATDPTVNYNDETVFSRKLPGSPSTTYNEDNFDKLNYFEWDSLNGLEYPAGTPLESAVGFPSTCFNSEVATTAPPTPASTGVTVPPGTTPAPTPDTTGATEEPDSLPATAPVIGMTTVVGSVFGSIAGLTFVVVALTVAGVPVLSLCGITTPGQSNVVVSNIVDDHGIDKERLEADEAAAFEASNPKFKDNIV